MDDIPGTEAESGSLKRQKGVGTGALVVTESACANEWGMPAVWGGRGLSSVLWVSSTRSSKKSKGID